LIADILGERMGCFLFQLPPSYRYTPARLDGIVSQLDPARRQNHPTTANAPDSQALAATKRGINFVPQPSPNIVWCFRPG
jgi:uncharacterized protein YecE (DUF72 family)